MLNERQDYFGQTVNIASRVQHLALSQAIFASGSVVTDPNGLAILMNSGVVPIPRQAALRGIPMSSRCTKSRSVHRRTCRHEANNAAPSASRGLWAEDGATAAGRLLHERVDAAPLETGLTSIIGRLVRASLS